MKLTNDHTNVRIVAYKVMVLNPKVRKELKGNPALFAIFRKIHGGYDSDIDPLHNPDYKETAAKEEEEALEQAKQHLSKSDEDLKTL